jgi:hypothetical protein
MHGTNVKIIPVCAASNFVSKVSSDERKLKKVNNHCMGDTVSLVIVPPS